MVKREELKTIKVKPETYKRLRRYQAKMVLNSDGEERYSMDDVINALLTFIETFFSEIEEPFNEARAKKTS